MSLNPLSATPSATPSPSSNALAADARTLNNLKLQAGQNTPEAIKETAKQFEALFMRELLKSMREATMKSGLMDSAQGDLGTDLLDQQFAVQMSGQPGGLSDMIAQQLTRQMLGAKNAEAQTTGQLPTSPPQAIAPVATTTHLGQSGFVARHSDAATRVAQSSGIPASFMIGQAAHESGWGQREIKLADGSSSFNLFGIKATPSWTGRVAQVVTTEYVNGEPQKSVAKFRAYDSYEDSFRDYAKLISQSPRYAQARQQTGSVQAYANSLQNAGYATDPDYAAKLSRAINTTLQVQRSQV